MNEPVAPAVQPPAHAETMTDEQAMWRVAMHDDAGAFAELVTRWQTPVHRLCARLTGDAALAEDFTQEAFTRIFARRQQWQPTARFSTYLWQVALNLCRDELRRARRKFEVPLDPSNGDEPDHPAPEPAPDAQLASTERAHLVRAALHKLDGDLREIVVLKHYENLKFREIAEVLGVPEGTVKTRMASALLQLTRLLKPALAEAPTPGAVLLRATALLCL